MISIIKNPISMRNKSDSIHKKGESIGFVPTMGNLHNGHISLVNKSVKECDRTVVSIFVNPIQFGQNEDLEKYPRTFKEDRKMLFEAGADFIFFPSVNAMYKSRMTEISVSGLTDNLCGRSRPGHFTGVATVVNKLFNIVNPDIAYFGEKDYQQLCVIRKMVFDLNMNIRIRGGRIIRESDGLAMSSRNRYLNRKDRISAAVLYRVLKKGKSLIEQNEEISSVKGILYKELNNIPNARVDYIEILDERNLDMPDNNTKIYRIFLAVYFGRTRLIDNIRVRI